MAVGEHPDTATAARYSNASVEGAALMEVQLPGRLEVLEGHIGFAPGDPLAACGAARLVLTPAACCGSAPGPHVSLPRR